MRIGDRDHTSAKTPTGAPLAGAAMRNSPPRVGNCRRISGDLPSRKDVTYMESSVKHGIVGPGTADFSLSLMKGISLHEQTKLQLSIEASNVFNHRNYEPPSTQVDAATFGQISGLQTAEGAGPRSLELAGRITF